MHAMQYEITLPADYDMSVIRRRVASRSALLDDFPGLGLKAYLIRERGKDGSPVNQYAPFYLWNTPHAMNSFLWGHGFRGVIDDFGRPVVQHWTGLAFEPGPARDSVPHSASRTAEPIPVGTDPATVVEQAVADAREYARTPGLHSIALAIDPRNWELIRFMLWEHSAPEETDLRYEVLHLSTPHLADIEVGRHW